MRPINFGDTLQDYSDFGDSLDEDKEDVEVEGPCGDLRDPLEDLGVVF